MSVASGRIAALAALGLMMAAAPPGVCAQWSAPPGGTVRNAFGPGGSLCRGACGGDCPDTCEPDHYLECIDDRRFLAVTAYDCGTHQGCREHDDCLDACTEWAPESTKDVNFYLAACSLTCHESANSKYGLKRTSGWTLGYGPRPHRTRFEYTKPSPDSAEVVYRCPDGMKLECTGRRGQCVPGPEEEPAEEEEPDDPGPDAPPRPHPIGILIENRPICLRPGEPHTLRASVVGLPGSGVRWRLVSGPGRLDPRSGGLEATGPGTLVVRAESSADARFADQAAIVAGDCGCSFSATLSGDSTRGLVTGDWSVFSTRGQAGLMGGMGGRMTAEAKEDLLEAMKLAGGQPAQKELMERLQQKITRGRGPKASRGGTLSFSFVETTVGRPGRTRRGDTATAFKLDAFAEQSVEAGFTGEVPLAMVALHTGEFASEGLGPMLYRWTPGAPGRARLVVTRYDGRWLQGIVTLDVQAVPALMKLDGSKPRVRVSLDFVAGIFNPLRMEVGCVPLGDLKP